MINKDAIIGYLYDLIYLEKSRNGEEVKIQNIKNLIEELRNEKDDSGVQSITDMLLKRKKIIQKEFLDKYRNEFMMIGPHPEKLAEFYRKKVEPEVQVESFLIDMQLKSLGYDMH